MPPPNLQTIRHYGLYTSAKQAEYEQCRALLPACRPPDAARPGAFDTVRKDGDDGRVPLAEYMAQRTHCPVCGKKLVISRVFPSSVTGKISPRDKALARKFSLARRRRRGG